MVQVAIKANIWYYLKLREQSNNVVFKTHKNSSWGCSQNWPSTQVPGTLTHFWVRLTWKLVLKKREITFVSLTNYWVILTQILGQTDPEIGQGPESGSTDPGGFDNPFFFTLTLLEFSRHISIKLLSKKILYSKKRILLPVQATTTITMVTMTQ